jgi:hypothetical protein
MSSKDFAQNFLQGSYNSNGNEENHKLLALIKSGDIGWIKQNSNFFSFLPSIHKKRNLVGHSYSQPMLFTSCWHQQKIIYQIAGTPSYTYTQTLFG